MRILKIKVYTINEHPNKPNCFDWIRNNWFDLNQHSVKEVTQSIKSLSEKIGGSVDYSISQEPERGEHITFKDYSQEKLCLLDANDCPLTGVCWDIDLINGLKEGKANKVLKSLHPDTEYQYSDKGLTALCEANNYEFKENGEFV